MWLWWSNPFWDFLWAARQKSENGTLAKRKHGLPAVPWLLDFDPYPFWGESPVMLEPTLVGIGIYTGGTISCLTRVACGFPAKQRKDWTKERGLLSRFLWSPAGFWDVDHPDDLVSVRPQKKKKKQGGKS